MSLGFGLSLGLSASTIIGFSTEGFSFTSVLPTEFTTVRVADELTARNSSGAWVGFAANTPRFDHTAAGVALGTRVDKVLGNKCAQENFAPTTATGVTRISGDGELPAVVTDSDIAAATIDGSLFTALQNGDVIELDTTSATVSTVYQITDTLGVSSTGHSWRLVMATDDTGFNGTLGFNDGLNGQNINNAIAQDYYEYTEENDAAHLDIRYLRLSVITGKKVRISAVQLEEKATLSYPIVTSGAAVVTAGREYLHADTADISAFNVSQGALIGEFVFDDLDGDDQMAMYASTNGGLSDAVGMYLVATSNQVRPRDIISASNKQSDDVHKPISGKRMPVAISWKDNESLAVAGPMRFENRTYTGTHNAMDDIYLGSRPFGSQMSGWVRSLTVVDTYRTLSQLGVYMFPASGSYRAIVSGGQSNKHGYFRSTVGQGNAGESSVVAGLNVDWTSTENWLINGAQDGSRVVDKTSPADDNWWYDFDTATFGPVYDDWETIAIAFGVDNIDKIDWDQGESDSNQVMSEYKTSTLAIFNKMRTIVGEVDVYFTKVGRRGDSESTNYALLRTAQEEIIASETWIKVAPEKFTQPLADGLVHLTDLGYGDHGTQLVDTILNDNNGPTITGAVRTGMNIVVTLAHDAGTDFTPTTDIAGFHFFDDSSEIAQSTLPTRTGASEITITLDSEPTGVETLYYGYASLFLEVATFGNLVIDNSTNGLSLQAYKAVL